MRAVWSNNPGRGDSAAQGEGMKRRGVKRQGGRRGALARGLRCLAVALAFASLPVRLVEGPGFALSAAWAKDGGSSGSGGHSGPGGGDDHDDDHDDDDHGGRSGRGGGSSGSGLASSPGDSASAAARIVIRGSDITVAYTDGWRESIRGGRYIMTDPRRRTVIDRPARGADRSRLFGYRP